jgi:hypothetical protein
MLLVLTVPNALSRPELPTRSFLFWLADPRVLPSERDILIVSAESNICSVAIANFYRLALADRKGRRPSYSRGGLLRLQILNAAQTGNSTRPEIAVQRYP